MPEETLGKKLILASASRTRREILQNAGIDFDVVPADINEEKIKQDMVRADKIPQDIAERLAFEKAALVSEKYPGCFILGADQILVCAGEIYSKASSMEEARQNLKTFRNRNHMLVTSLVLVKGGTEVWRTTDTPCLVMRDFSDAFLEDYLEKAGEDILSSVGCYFLEGTGLQLFSRIDGNYFSILGLPVINLLEKLRQLNILSS